MLASSLDPTHLTTQTLQTPQGLLQTLQMLYEDVEASGEATFQQWQGHIHRSEFLSSALNLAHYLALRRHDLRPLQAALMPWGLSSLGRLESRVMPNLMAVMATLSALCQTGLPSKIWRPQLTEFLEGRHLLEKHTEELFGPALVARRVRIMVTLPTEAADNYVLVREILKRGAACVRINCAHDGPEIWQAMINHVHRASAEIGQPCRILMDLAGPKIRTGPVFYPREQRRLFRDDYLVLLRQALPLPPEPADTSLLASPLDLFCTSCTEPDVLDCLTIGAAVYMDDGKLRTRVVATDYGEIPQHSGLLLQVTHASPKGVKLRPEKGLNFPGTALNLSPLTDKDRQDLNFAATQADLIGYSFVQKPADIDLLQAELQNRLGATAPLPPIIAKIETDEAVRNLPELIIHAAGKQPFGVMIARGDLAVEIGYQRLTEIQEEILWLCEAAHVPVIWATQVLESLVKNGAPSRGEMTDAAMAERAECVMLNKGPFIAEAVTILADVLTRMEAHQLKKTPQLRALRSW